MSNIHCTRTTGRLLSYTLRFTITTHKRILCNTKNVRYVFPSNM